MFSYFSPQKGTLTLTLGMGMGGDHLGPPKSPKISKNNTKYLRKSKVTHKPFFFLYLFPPKGTLTLTPGMGVGGTI